MTTTFAALTAARAALHHCEWEHSNWPTAQTAATVQRARQAYDDALAADKTPSPEQRARDLWEAARSECWQQYRVAKLPWEGLSQDTQHVLLLIATKK